MKHTPKPNAANAYFLCIDFFEKVSKDWNWTDIRSLLGSAMLVDNSYPFDSSIASEWLELSNAGDYFPGCNDFSGELKDAYQMMIIFIKKLFDEKIIESLVDLVSYMRLNDESNYDHSYKIIRLWNESVLTYKSGDYKSMDYTLKKGDKIQIVTREMKKKGFDKDD